MTTVNPIILTHHCQGPKEGVLMVDYEVLLTAAGRRRCRQRLTIASGLVIHFHLPRGSHIHPNDYFQTADGTICVQVKAKPESVITVTGATSLQLLRAAYHLGNRHIPLEVRPGYLRFTPDHVLEEMLVGLGVQLQPEVVPFFPEDGAYGNHHH